MIDIGTHHGEYQGAPTIRNQIIVRWEIPAETIEIEGKPQPMLVSKFYTNSLSEKANLRADLTAWRGKAFTPEELMKFDIQTILGKPCLLTVVHNEKKKAKVTAVSGLAKGMECPKATNPTKAFWIEDWNGSEEDEQFAGLPKGFRALIMESDEYKALMRGEPGSNANVKHVDTLDDDIPF